MPDDDDLLHQPHDKFFKAVFSTAQVAREHIEAFLPLDVVAHLRLDEMVLDTTAYISKRFKSFQSDVVWRVPYKNGQVKVVVLYEHKTAYDRYIHLQVLRYMLEIWEYRLKKSKKDRKYKQKADAPLDIIIPVVVYQGVGGWEKIKFQDLFGVQDAEILPFLPVFDYILNQTSPESEAHLQKVNKLNAYIAYRTMRQVIEDALSFGDLVVFIEQIAEIMDNATAEDADLTSRVYTYIFGISEVDVHEVMASVHISTQQKNNAMSSLQQLYQKGEQHGIAIGKSEGIAIGEQKGASQTTKILKIYTRGFDAVAIAEKLEINLEFVHTVIAQYEAED